MLGAAIVAAVAGCGSGGSPVLLTDISGDVGRVAVVDVLEAVAPPADVRDAVDGYGVEAVDSAELFIECEPGTGCFLDPCEEHSDCLFGPCLQHLGGKACSQTCFEECPAGFECKQLQGFEPDIVFACVSNFSLLCRPCVEQEDCATPWGVEEACVRYPGGASFCGADCVTSGCPAGYSCTQAETLAGVAVMQCVADGELCSCSSESVQLGLFTNCFEENEHGMCLGRRVCAEDGLLPCDASIPALEECNGIDDDCDGDTDSGTCDDDNACTEDFCESQTGCTNDPLTGTGCDDGNVCTLADHCAQGECTGTAIDCDDKNPCTWDNCEPTGGCVYTYNSADCDDADPCTVGDACKFGDCAGYAVDCDCTDDADCLVLEDGDVCNGTLVCDKSKMPFVCTVDPATPIECPAAEGAGKECLAPQCHPLTGDCSLGASGEGKNCDDEDACTVGETCSEGLCAGGIATNCNDGNLCTTDLCEPAAGCIHEDNSAPCNDDNVCTVGDQCGDGFCQPGEMLDCNDGNVCTDDSCNSQLGCQHTPNNEICDDQNTCTTDDLCVDGTCVGSGTLECDDGNVCTKDVCLPDGGCEHVATLVPCSDGDPCTVNDQCEQGACVSGQSVECDDGNVCTDDSCSDGGCVYEPLAGPCDDGNACTEGDWCKAGSCIPEDAVDCDDGNHCTTDWCTPQEGCLHADNSQPCDDGDACTSGEKCSGATCQGGLPVNCNDGDVCTDDSCHPELGCVHNFNIAQCNDHDVCTTVDTCAAGVCQGAEILECDDGNTCTDDSCDATVGCVHESNESVCDDGNACTTADVCTGGVCAGGPQPDCGDNNPCTTDVCLWESGCTHFPAGTGAYLGLCLVCDGSGGEESPADDPACGDIECSGLDHNFTLGESSATGTNQCVSREYQTISAERCASLGACKGPNSDHCTVFADEVVAECGLCRYAEGACEECSTYPDQTPCGPGLWCQQGACVEDLYGDGSDGELVVTQPETVINDYAWVTTEEVAQGSQEFAVNDGSAFEPGDEVLVWQVQHEANAGTHEYAHISQKEGNLLTLAAPLANDYYSGLFDAVGAAATQVVRVPHFETLIVNPPGSITAPAWNGYSGGVVVLRAAGQVTVDGSIYVTGRGFRAGPVTCCNCDGHQGEGWAGIGALGTAENHGGGGGSTWSQCGGDSTAGGSGGGGHGEDGETGNDCNGCGCGTDQGGEGGHAFGGPELTAIHLGGGAGSNGRDNNCSVGNGAPGSPGGGIIALFAPSITVEGTISADGGDNSASAGQDSTGPASGAGGSVYLSADTLVIGDNRVTARPGAPGWTHWCCKAPVSGAVGRIRLDYDELQGTTNPVFWHE